jgi:hypothetical protein
MKRSPIGRTKRVNPINRKRRAERHEAAYGDDSRIQWMHTFGCCVCGGRPIEIAHVKSRGAGGTADDTVPMCTHHHTEQHDGIQTFQARHAIDLTAKAAHYARLWHEDGGYSIGF